MEDGHRGTPEQLRGLVLNGLAWKVTSQLFGQGGRLAVAVVLARLLDPREFGLAGMVLVFSSLVLVFSDLALGAALIQRTTLTEEERTTAFWTSVAAGTLFTAIGVASSGLVAGFYREPEVQPLLIVMSSTFLITSLATTHEALLVRDMQFRAVEIRVMIGLGVGAVAGIAAAVNGLGAWAIIAQQVSTALVTTVLLIVRSPWRAKFSFSRRALRDMSGFSGFVLGHRLLYYVHRNADNLLIGRFLGAASLGVYGLAYNVMLIPFSRIAGPVQQVMFPAFARLQDQPQRIAELWVRATRIVGAISIPALCGLVVVAPDFVPIVFGQKWDAAVPIIQVLAWVGLLQSLQTLNTEILQALDRTSTIFRFSVGFFSAHLLAFVIGLHWGVLGVAVAYAISTTLVEPIFTWMTARALKVSPFILVRALTGVVAASLVMAAVVFEVRELLVAAGTPPLLRLVIEIAAGVATYLPLCAWRQPELREEISSLLRIARGRRIALRPSDSTA